MINNDPDFESVEHSGFVLDPDELRITTFLSESRDAATLMIVSDSIKGTLQLSIGITKDELEILSKALYTSISDTLINSFNINGEITKC